MRSHSVDDDGAAWLGDVSDAKTPERPDGKQKDADGHTATVTLKKVRGIRLKSVEMPHADASYPDIKNRELKDFRPFILILHSAVCTI